MWIGAQRTGPWLLHPTLSSAGATGPASAPATTLSFLHKPCHHVPEHATTLPSILCFAANSPSTALARSFLVSDIIQWCLLCHLPYLMGQERVSTASRLPVPARLLPPNRLFLAMHAAALHRPSSTLRGMRIQPKPRGFSSSACR